MKWISTKDHLPKSDEEAVLAYINQEIYMGSFSATESWYENSDGSKRDYKKTITFYASYWLNKNYCDKDECITSESKCGDQCVYCCEEDYKMKMLLKYFPLDKVTHWMPLPEPPKND